MEMRHQLVNPRLLLTTAPEINLAVSCATAYHAFPLGGQDGSRALNEIDHNVDVVARGFGIWTRLMRDIHQGLSYATLDARQ